MSATSAKHLECLNAGRADPGSTVALESRSSSTTNDRGGIHALSLDD